MRDFLIDNPHRSTGLLEFLEESKNEVVRLQDNNFGYKAEYVIKVKFLDHVDEDLDNQFTKFLHSSQQVVATSGENDQVYERMRVGLLKSWKTFKWKSWAS